MDGVETYSEWITRIMSEFPHKRGTQRYGQYLYNNMPDRFLQLVPRGVDPFYDDNNCEMFLNWLERHW
jgi:hypothetical protein